MSLTPRFRAPRPGIAALWGLLYLAGGCAPRPAVLPRKPPPRATAARAPGPSPVELRCERISSEAVRVVIRNRTARPHDMRLHEKRFAGRVGSLRGRAVAPPGGIWDEGWTQEGIHLPARGTWSALVYEGRMEKLEVRDRADRLLTDFNLMQNLPRLPEPIIMALHSRPDWHPFGPDRRAAWRTLLPSEARLSFGDTRSQILVVGDVPPESFTREQLDDLRRRVESGRTLILCGGTDGGRLRAWERTGLLAAPARGTRVVPELRSLAQRYGASSRMAPVAVTNIARVAPPVRVRLEERGIPLVVERPLGLGTLVLVTFDPTRPPFRGSALELAFWQEWLLRNEDDFPGLVAGMEDAAAYRQVRQKLHLIAPRAGMIGALGVGYLAILFATLLAVRRRIRALVAVSILGSIAALALGPVLRSPVPVAGFAGLLYLRSGDSRGWGWGHADVMTPESGTVTLRVPHGSPFMWWDSPRLRLPGSPSIVVQPLMRRWTPRSVLVRGPVGLPGGVRFDLELHQDGIFAAVRNRTPYRLNEMVAIWGQTALVRLGDLPAGGETRRLLARVENDGTLRAVRDRMPNVYGQATGFGNSPDAYPTPLLMAHCPGAPLPALLARERPARGEGHTAVLVKPSGFRVSGAFRLPGEASTAQVGRAERSERLWVWGQRGTTGRLLLEPDGRAAVELQLPAGAGSARWRVLALQIEADVSMSSMVEAFDWAQQRWVTIAALPADPSFPAPAPSSPMGRFDPFRRGPTRTRSLALPSPERFVNRHTDTVLTRLRNTSAFPATIDVTMRGRGVAR